MIKMWKKGVQVEEGDILVRMVQPPSGGVELVAVDPEGRTIPAGHLLNLTEQGFMRCYSVSDAVKIKKGTDGAIDDLQCRELKRELDKMISETKRIKSVRLWEPGVEKQPGVGYIKVIAREFHAAVDVVLVDADGTVSENGYIVRISSKGLFRYPNLTDRFPLTDDEKIAEDLSEGEDE